MKAEIKERVYLLIIIFCMFMCGAMVITMLTGEKPGENDEHVPAMREIIVPQSDEDAGGVADNKDSTEADSNGPQDDKNTVINQSTEKNNGDAAADNSQLAITEDFINGKLEDFLPSGFPLEKPRIDIDADGIITIKGKALRDELKKYLTESGNELSFKYSITLLMLPAEFDVEAAISVGEGKDGTLDIKPYSLSLSGNEVPADAFPKKITESISKTVNNVVTGIGDMFIFSGFEDGAILFEKV